MLRDHFHHLGTAFTGALVLCALTVTGLVVRRELRLGNSAAPAAPVQPPLDVSASWPRLTARGHRIGPADAPIRIVEFSDFQCPFCASAQTALRELQARHPSQFALLYRHYPLSSIHPFARPAALAASCAGAQGRFEAFHDLLFATQDSVGITPWSELARRAEVADVRAFDECVTRGDYDVAIDEDVRTGQRIGVGGTPTFVVEGRMLREAPTVEALERLLFPDTTRHDVAAATPRP